ncbi:MAG: 16S rRNA (guanine(966)-N(2))-methyltransferase RsmD [Gammaproteobacteria bacterium]|jgi:16S rRNA (guanine966-N2)-methyltransferase|nr:16S rRNA (guanine(966)-N(2))-methyltransferase RsmD [Gammaproteobacteria bacterium]MBU1504776.1 16S rRNA (guanine(966)-N(2))-methyltransferase RsmD [Gammaproteobacteria bacterium]MBU2122513.1 16S rRNA (guanine(966)-N(2))-methyltransferase RsmD [Gammaproteobacteria bacterium]MBU2198925.1 16S rRNA (guanine(966)-N(2))-methyltransferase RsmD [Gammaproteobacteria bacterium]MBU2273553.1 16S rRNA (guanine(966)-N(2))-methyltransferase RsmD [Gammaproteobacteria bacterium]
MSRSTLRPESLPGGRLARAASAAAAEPAAKPAKKAAAPAASKGSGEIRIIGGAWKRTRLPVAQRPGLRPTPDRVRETLFNWLGQDLTGWRCLDAFAGTGALGLEAASRGAAAVQLVESDPTLVIQLHTLQQRLKAAAVRVQRGDGIAALKQAAPASVDLVLIDPPFDSALFEPALQSAARAVAAGGFIYLEAPARWTEEQLAPWGLVVHRHLKAGAVHAHLLRLGAAVQAPTS